MSDFLTNLAALRSQYNDGGSDIVRQFMPMVGYAIGQSTTEVVSEAELQDIIFETMQFRIPFGAIRVFINRAANTRYGYITRNLNGTYSPNRKAIAEVKFAKRRTEAQAHQSHLKRSFREFCQRDFSTTPSDQEIEKHFFEILFDISPKVMRSLADPVRNQLDDEEKSETSLRYRVYSFVRECVNIANIELEYIEEFIHGAVLAESFFYSTPSEGAHRMQDVKVFFDTTLLIQAIGLAEDAEAAATRELIDLLRILKAKIRCFRETRNELHGIIYAIHQSIAKGQDYVRRPGDVGDIMLRKGYDISDVALLVNSLDQKLMDQGIVVEERPLLVVTNTLALDEASLTESLIQEFTQSSYASWPSAAEASISIDRRVRHDVQCLTGVFQLRDYRRKNSLEKCSAIFITSNVGLFRVAELHFQRHFEDEPPDTSVAPVCMLSNVFTMLMWLKAVDRKPGLSKDRLVANSIAALSPSPELWSEFLKNLRKLLESGDLTQAEFDYISNTMETRTILMTATEGDPDVITLGTAVDIKNKVFQREITDKDLVIVQLTESLRALERKNTSLSEKIDSTNERVRALVRKIVWRLFQIGISLPFLILFVNDIVTVISGRMWSSWVELATSISLAFVTVATILSLFVIAPLRRKLRTISDRLVSRLFID